jgi:uncharacterized membrane protein YfcA
MLQDISVNEVLLLALAQSASGAIAGLLAGLFGIGGGAIIVPVMYQFLGVLGIDEAVRMHISVGTSLGIILPTSIRSFQAHRARGSVDMALLKSWLVPMPLGVIAATLVASFVSGAQLRGIFAAIAVLIGLRLIFNRENWRLGTELPGGIIRATCGALIGFVSTLMGVGGGVMATTFMTLYGRPMLQAVATSAGTGALIAVPGVIGYAWAGWGVPGLPPFSVGYVNVLGIFLVIPITVYVAPLGVRIAHIMSKRQLETSFGIFMLLVALRFALSLL